MARPLVGIDAYSLIARPAPPTNQSISERNVFAMLEKVKELGGEGLQASLPDDHGELRAAFDRAAELDLYLEPYAPLPLHWRNDAEIITRREGKFHLICEVAAQRGVKALHCTMGARERFESYPRWREFVVATAQVLQRLAPLLRDHGLRIGIENHWDYTTYEIVRIAEQVGPEVVGVGLDTGNLPILAEAPDRGLERSAPFVVTTHLKDVYLITTERGAARPIVGLGEGQIGMAEAVRLLHRHNPDLNFTIEDHPVIYDVDYFESWWLDAVPELTTYDIATTARLAREGDRWVSEHRVADPHAAELVPWSIRGPERLRNDVIAVRQWLSQAEVARDLSSAAAPQA